MTLTGQQVREACRILRWNRYDLQRRTALPFHVVDRAMTTETAIEATLAREIVLKDAFHRAGIEFTPEGLRLRGVVTEAQKDTSLDAGDLSCSRVSRSAKPASCWAGAVPT